MGINWGGIADGFTLGLTDFDNQGSTKGFWDWQFNPIGGGHDKKWGPSVGTQAGDYLGEYIQSNPEIFGSGTQQVGAPAPGSNFQFSSATAPAGSSFVSSDYGSGGGGNKIGSWYMDEGSAPMLAEAMIRQKYTPLERRWHNETFGSGGVSGGSSGNGIKQLAGGLIGSLGNKIIDSIG